MADYSKTDFYTDVSIVDDPWPYFEYLRGQGPVVPLPYHNVVAVTGHDEAIQVLNNPSLFSSINAPTGPFPPLPFTPEGDDITEQLEAHRSHFALGSEIVSVDGAVHQAMRALVNPLFTPGRLKALEQRFQAVSEQLVEEFAEAGEVEIVSGYGTPFATLIIAELLGVPDDDRDLFREWLKDGIPSQVNATEGSANPLVLMYMKVAEYLGQRRTQPREDLLSLMANTKFPDGSLPPIELVARVASFVFGAGQDTTSRLLASTVRILGERPDLQQRLREEPGLIPDFVEETLRYEGSVKTAGRLALKTTTLGGVEIKAGTVMMIANMAANRDPRRWDSPNDFVIGRSRNKEHLAFGRGAHTCAGAPLARAEVRISIQKLLDRCGDIRISDKHHGAVGQRSFHYEPTFGLRALHALHVEFTPKAPQS